MTTLSSSQQQVLNCVLSGQSVFFTGPAGCGKSFCLRVIIDGFRQQRKQGVYITASTGIAAVPLQGRTLHSFAGIGLGEGTAEEIYQERVVKNAKAIKRWDEARILIIDEISMIQAELLDKLNYIAKRVRKRDEPFGGIQLILTGDFLQLPPVSPGVTKAKLAFEADCWKEIVPHCILLEKVFRQDKDPLFISILNSIRKGVVTQEVIDGFQPCLNRVFPATAKIKPTLLFAKRVDVDQTNANELAKLRDLKHEYKAQDWGRDSTALEILIKNCMAPTTLELKINAQVMLLKNLSLVDGLVNGTRGVVVDFKTDERNKFFPVVQFLSGKQLLVGPEEWKIEEKYITIASRVQIPLMLCWALTIHKIQGMTLDLCQVDLTGVFEFGQGYTALSRCRDLDSLSILSSSTAFPSRLIKAHPGGIQFYEGLEQQQQQTLQADDLPPPLSPVPSFKRPRIEDDDDDDDDIKQTPINQSIIQRSESIFTPEILRQMETVSPERWVPEYDKLLISTVGLTVNELIFVAHLRAVSLPTS